jgi:hypothetical protein
MAKVRVKNLKSVFNAVQAIFEDSIKSQGFLDGVKDFAVLRIQAETRKGNDLKEERKQPALSPNYIKWRKKLAKGLSGSGISVDPEFFVAGKSNLTLSGEMLNSLTGSVIKSKNEIEVKVTGRRSDGETNSSVAKDLASRGRFFLGLDEKGIQYIRKQAVDLIRRVIRRKGFTK